MTKKADTTQAVEQATITSPGKGEDAKSPPLSYRTRSGRLVKVKNPKGTSPSKIPVRANINAGDARSDPEYSSESENDQADEEEIDPAKAEQNEAEVSALTNDQLKERLLSLGIQIGPIVESTRKVYEKKLVKLMNNTVIEYSTDEEEPVGAIAEQPTEEEKPAVQQVRKTRRKKEDDVKDKYSDDEEEMPVVTNTSSRRRSTRVAAKKIAEVPAEEPIKEESAEEAAEVSAEQVVENGNGDASPVAEKVEVPETFIEQTDEISSEEITQEKDEVVVEEDVPQIVATTARPIPYHTIAVTIIMSILIAIIWKQRDQHAIVLEYAFKWFVAQYTNLYDSLMPDVEQLPPLEQPAETA